MWFDLAGNRYPGAPSDAEFCTFDDLPRKACGGLSGKPDRRGNDSIRLFHGDMTGPWPVTIAVHPGIYPTGTENVDGYVVGPDFLGTTVSSLSRPASRLIELTIARPGMRSSAALLIE